MDASLALINQSTGTLTQNKMTVSHVWLDRRVRTTEFLHREGNFKTWDSFAELVTTGPLCNMCKFEVDESAPSVASLRGPNQGNYSLVGGPETNNNTLNQ